MRGKREAEIESWALLIPLPVLSKEIPERCMGLGFRV
jgi:hypothetical protein